ncbi:MAG TPA: hypothetical protein VJA21_08455 [Verrucomicrobiae bacterium]
MTKRAYGWPEDAQFLVPDAVYDHFADGIGKCGAEARKQWTERFAAYRMQFPALATEIEEMQRRELSAGWDRDHQRGDEAHGSRSREVLAHLPRLRTGPHTRRRSQVGK